MWLLGYISATSAIPASRPFFRLFPVPLVPAFGSLDVDFRCSAHQNKGAGQARHRGAKGGAGEGLTVGAMADPDLGRVDFGREADLTAMAASGDFHRHFSLTIPARCRAR